jgi:KRAB domain-containing zinc finger protein
MKRIHEGIRKFKCNHCEKTFYSQKQYRLHSTIHSGEKPYVCSCSAGYYSQRSLTRHQATHGHSGLGKRQKDPVNGDIDIETSTEASESNVNLEMEGEGKGKASSQYQ